MAGTDSENVGKFFRSGNIFEKIIRGKIPCYKIFETKHCIAILDAFPCSRGHSLLVCKHKYATIMEMPAEIAGAYLRELPRLANAVKTATGCDGINILQNNLEHAGQVVFQAHFHAIPRWKDDGFKTPSHSKGKI